jgi:hypothetical protein
MLSIEIFMAIDREDLITTVSRKLLLEISAVFEAKREIYL